MVDDALVALVRRYVALSDADAERVVAAWGEPRTVRAGEVLLAPGRRCRSLFFQDEGFGRFYTETDAADVTRHFVTPGTYFTVVASLYSGTPSREGLQAITAGRVRELPQETNEQLCASCPAWDAFREGYVREVYAYLDETLDALRSQTAAERYDAFVETSPETLLRVPLRYVASYLGMTPQSLSRIRARRG